MENKPLSTTIRPPHVAGSFYPANKENLLASVQQAFLDPGGPGHLPTLGMKSKGIFAAVVPHAGYQYSASVAAWAYAEMAAESPQAIVLLGVNHHGYGSRLALAPEKGWQTPLGISPIQHELSAHFQKFCSLSNSDAAAHQFEHSLEVQLPFIQYIYGELPILPILFGRLNAMDLFQAGRALAELSAFANVIFLASSDFSHYLPQAEANRLDRLALAEISAINPQGLLKVVNDNNITMCGVAPVAAMLFAAVEHGVQQASCLHYHTSGDVTGDKSSVVGYGAAVLYKHLEDINYNERK